MCQEHRLWGGYNTPGTNMTPNNKQAPTVNTNVNLRKTRSKAVATKISINKKPTALTNRETV